MRCRRARPDGGATTSRRGRPVADRPRRIPFLEPELPELAGLADDLAEVHGSGVFSNGGPFDRKLAANVESYLGGGHCVPVASATAGLMLAIDALARRDATRKVLLPSFTFAASALAVEWAGFEPLFCDIDEASWQPAPDASFVERNRDRIALILVCNTFGSPADIGAWKNIAAASGIPIVVDSASGFGGSYADGSRLGRAGVTEVFSMHATKPLAVGEGGLIVTDDAALAGRLRSARNFGLDEQRICAVRGLNGKLPELSAAIACRVLERYDDIVGHRRRLAARYRERLEPAGFAFQRHGELSPFQAVPVIVPPAVSRDEFQRRLEGDGIETRRYFAAPLHTHPHLRGCETAGALDVTDAVAHRIVCLPMSNRLADADVERVCASALAVCT